MRAQTLPHRVYFVESPTDSTVMVALDVHIDEEDYIRWFDTVKERVMKVARVLDADPAHFIFKRDDANDGIYTFIPMTLVLYNEKVKQRVLVPQDFAEEEAMLKAFEETKKNAW